MILSDPCRRGVLQMMSAALLCSCSTSPTLDLIGRTVAAKNRAKGRYPLTDDQLRALPYATLGVVVGRSSPSVMVLSHTEGNFLYWVSSDRVVFVTCYGRLVRTQGLRRDLLATEWKKTDPLGAVPGQMPDPDGLDDVERTLQIGVKDSETVIASSQFRETGKDFLPSLDGLQSARLIMEKVDVRDWRWSAENFFWIADSGMVIKSRQQFCPEIPAIYFELLKRPASFA